jgi:hypothetical protein
MGTSACRVHLDRSIAPPATLSLFVLKLHVARDTAPRGRRSNKPAARLEAQMNDVRAARPHCLALLVIWSAAALACGGCGSGGGCLIEQLANRVCRRVKIDRRLLHSRIALRDTDNRSNRATCRTLLRMRAQVAHGIRKLFRAVATEQIDGFRQIGRADAGSLRVTQWSSSVQLRDDSLHVERCNFALELLEHRRELLVRSNHASGRG